MIFPIFASRVARITGTNHHDRQVNYKRGLITAQDICSSLPWLDIKIMGRFLEIPIFS
jgi:hypothetical protein